MPVIIFMKDIQSCEKALKKLGLDKAAIFNADDQDNIRECLSILESIEKDYENAP